MYCKTSYEEKTFILKIGVSKAKEVDPQAGFTFLLNANNTGVRALLRYQSWPPDCSAFHGSQM